MVLVKNYQEVVIAELSNIEQGFVVQQREDMILP